MLILAKNGVFFHKDKMKIQRISNLQSKFYFPNFENNYQVHLTNFYRSDLGKIYQAIPWSELVKSFNIKDSHKGPQSIFSPRGKIALMFLKHYAGCSDKRLIAQLNANIDYQIFCDILIPPTSRIENYKIVSEIRCELAVRLNIDDIQKKLADHWRAYCSNKDSMVCDATCYESYVRFPTDVKLLYETVMWNYKQLKSMSRQIKQRLPRSKMAKWKKRYSSYSKSRRPSKVQTRSITRGLLKLLKKIDGFLHSIENQNYAFKLPPKYYERRHTTINIIQQQWDKFMEGIKPKNRIVSLDKPYIRPIVRGKEIKKVEFGAKVHKLQIDGISFIEHLSFDAFNEGTRLQQTIYTAQSLMKTRTKILGADGIYANNKNRKYVTDNNIKTDFKRKGKPSKHKDHYALLAQMITKQRASAMEGSFGTDKEHFLLNRIKARTKETEILWIFFGIHTSNALKIGRRISQNITKAA